MNKILLTTLFLLALSTGGTKAQTFGNVPPLHVDGKYLKDDKGNVVRLHGVMDTPSDWFNSGRWGWGIDDSKVAPCINYFNKLYTAITDTVNGAY